MDTEDLLRQVAGSVPGGSLLISNHLDDQEGEVLLHLLVADLRRMLLDRFQTDDVTAVVAGLSVLDRALRDGDQQVENAVAVSFVEDSQWWDPRMASFVEIWPPGLSAEVTRQ